MRRSVAFILLAALVAVFGLQTPLGNSKPVGSLTHVAGQDNMICDDTSQLTSPWSYHALASGIQNYTVDQYMKLNTDGTESATSPGSAYGTTLPTLPQHIIGEGGAAIAAKIFAPGSDTAQPAFDFPEQPLMYFFEGGSYGQLALDTISGDEFIGGATNGYPEPQFDNGNNAGGINGQNGSHYYSGGDSTLASTANAGATTVTTASSIPGFINYITFADGSTYQIASASGTSITLYSPLAATQSSGSAVWANQDQPLAYVSTGGAQGASSITLTSSTVPLVQYGEIHVGANAYVINSITGTQSGGYNVNVGSLDTAVVAGAPVYYSDLSGDVTVSYLDIAHDSHNTTGTIYTGAGWTITHNNIHDGYKDSSGVATPGLGVALYGGDRGTIEYNCLDKMGDYGINVFGTGNKFDYNEVRDSNYLPDPGCGCSGGGKWWGTLNADIVGNAFVDDSPGGGVPIWLDNGNTGTLIKDNFFSRSYGSAVHSETGYNLDIENNLFQDGGWGDGIGGCGDNCIGAVNMNSSGGFHVPGSRYDDQVTIAGNQFVNNWSGVSIWQAGGRSCENSGEGWPDDAGYCSGGYPNSASTANAGQYNFSHSGDTAHGFTTNVAQNSSAGSSTVLVAASMAVNDQVSFVNPSTANTTNTTSISTFSGSGTITVDSTSGFPSSGQLSAATSNGDTVLDYTGTTATSFTGVKLITTHDKANSGTLSGSIKVNDPAYSNTINATNVSTFSGSGTITVDSTSGFPSAGQLRVGTSAAWSDASGSWTGAVLSYTGKTSTTFTGVSLVRGTGTLSGPVQQVQPYKVTSETCYANDCSVSITPSLSSSVTTGMEVTNAGTCQLFATAAALPSGPLAPGGTSYWDGCQWESQRIAINGNTFVFQPSQINDGTPINGGGTVSAHKNTNTNSFGCTAANDCGVNFMADQYNSGEAPFTTEIGANAMMSNSTLTGCPTWDSGCATNPLANLNALSSPPGAPAGNGEAAGNDVWSSNTFVGPWDWHTYIYGNCGGGGVFMPSDPATGHSLDPSVCDEDFAHWQSDWQQDQGSAFTPMAVSISNLTSGQAIHGAAQSVTAYEDTQTGNTISSSLIVGTTTDSTVSPLSSTPHTFNLNTLGYHDGPYTIKVSATDSGSNTGNDTVPIIIDNGDLNGDSHVNISDLAVMASHWGQNDSNYAHGNITGQSTINIYDLAVLANNWGYSH